MPRYRLRTLFVAMFLIAAGIGFIKIWSARTGTISYINYGRISTGMSLREVEQLLGSAGTEFQLPGTMFEDRPTFRGDRYYFWYGTSTRIFISLRDGAVVDKYCLRVGL